MGTAKVTLNISDCNHTITEKCPVGDLEYSFYQYTAGELNEAEFATPKLFSADATQRKLVIEYIPPQVEQAAAASDDAIVMLGRLHCYPVNSECRYHTHLWSEVALEKSLIPLTLPNKSEHQLRRFQQRSDELFGYQNLISGDSNAGNWGRRENGDLVLFRLGKVWKRKPCYRPGPSYKENGGKTKIYGTSGTLLPVNWPPQLMNRGEIYNARQKMP